VNTLSVFSLLRRDLVVQHAAPIETTVTPGPHKKLPNLPAHLGISYDADFKHWLTSCFRARQAGSGSRDDSVRRQ
jgi:hypothetical protein